MGSFDSVIVGGGFGGMAVAHELSLGGWRPLVLESDARLGGLAGSFLVDGYQVEKFYHHWFTSDRAILRLIAEIGLESQIKYVTTNTGIYHANRIFRLSRPTDLLRFRALPVFDRLRTGLMAVRARRVKNWRRLEARTALEWLRDLGGQRAVDVIWEPLLRGKFGEEADNISAVWMWNKLRLRGGSRGKGGGEKLVYYRGGFGAFVARWRDFLTDRGVVFRTGVSAREVIVENGRATGVVTDDGVIRADTTVVTTPLPVFLKLVPALPRSYRDRTARIRFLGNTCLIMRLRQKLSDTYWLNVADPAFPFVGVIEHTNLEGPRHYGGRHIVYLSKYVSVEHPLYVMNSSEMFDFTLPHLQRMFPAFDRSWVVDLHLWRAPYSQPVVTRHYGQLIPVRRTPVNGLWLSTMAQIYPEDRGTNYAVAYGRRVGREMMAVHGACSDLTLAPVAAEG